MREKGKRPWASKYSVRRDGERLLLERGRDGFRVVHAFPLVGDGQARSKMEAFRKEVARMLLRVAEGENHEGCRSLSGQHQEAGQR